MLTDTSNSNSQKKSVHISHCQLLNEKVLGVSLVEI